MKIRRSLLHLLIIIPALSTYASTIYASSFQPVKVIDPYRPITYSKMIDYIYSLEKNFNDLISIETIGQSVDQKDIILVKVGTGNTLIHINGSIHARERITTNIILKNIEDYCNAYIQNNFIEGYDVKDLLDKVTIYYIPMVNPDGVDYTVLGKKGITDPYLKNNIDSIYRSPYAECPTGSSNWKANIRGVDLNRQWNSNWEKKLLYDPGKPSNAYYKGTAPLTEPEVQAIYKLTLNNPFIIHVSYHTQGKLIYWYKNQEGSLLDQSRNITNKIKTLTDFNPTPSIFNTPKYFESNAGYTDWTVQNLKKPGFTIEFAYGSYSEKDFDSIYKPSKALGLLFAQEALNLIQEYNKKVYIDGQLAQVFENEEDAKYFIKWYISADSSIEIIDNETIIFSNSIIETNNDTILDEDFIPLP